MESSHPKEPVAGRNAKNLAAALNGGGFLFGLSLRRRFGLFVFLCGVAAFPIAVVLDAANQWLWVGIAIFFVLVGVALLLVGAKVSSTEPWPPYGPY